jgi:Cof subfamily protein (haloacid dehalogenase superfamily)
MSKKIIFFDIDGTLFAPDIGIPKSTLNAIEKLLENNHIPVICTGRSRAMIPNYMVDLGFQGVIAGAGTYISYKDKIIHQVIQDSKCAEKVRNLLIEGNISFILEGPEYIYYDSEQDERDEYIDSAISNLGMEKFKAIDDGDVKFNKISARVAKDSVVNPILKENYDMIIHDAFNVIEMVPKGYNKAVGIQKMIEHLDISQKDTYAFGDSTNDIEMLDFVEYGVAMGNGYSQVLERAKYTTKSIYEDGIYYGLKEFDLI